MSQYDRTAIVLGSVFVNPGRPTRPPRWSWASGNVLLRAGGQRRRRPTSAEISRSSGYGRLTGRRCRPVKPAGALPRRDAAAEAVAGVVLVPINFLTGQQQG